MKSNTLESKKSEGEDITIGDRDQEKTIGQEEMTQGESDPVRGGMRREGREEVLRDTKEDTAPEEIGGRKKKEIRGTREERDRVRESIPAETLKNQTGECLLPTDLKKRIQIVRKAMPLHRETPSNQKTEEKRKGRSPRASKSKIQIR